jgi:hypothetical protein
MAYMIMLILSSPSDLDDVLDAWREVGVRNATFIESSCSSEGECRPRHHIPIRFAFENLDPSTERCSCTLFAIAQDKATVQECISRVEAVVGDLDEVSGTAPVAWPLPIAKGIPSLFQTLEDA